MFHTTFCSEEFNYPVWVLSQLRIPTSLAHPVAHSPATCPPLDGGELQSTEGAALAALVGAGAALVEDLGVQAGAIQLPRIQCLDQAWALTLLHV